jgi:hypothetical protein
LLNWIDLSCPVGANVEVIPVNPAPLPKKKSAVVDPLTFTLPVIITAPVVLLKIKSLLPLLLISSLNWIEFHYHQKNLILHYLIFEIS